jgi:predicted aspartyl protease
MASAVASPQITCGRLRKMGKVVTRIVVTNRIDQALAERGLIPASSIRSVILEGVLVDTGASILSLPREMVTQLGLDKFRDAAVETATGVAELRIFRDADLLVEGREGTSECLELPAGAPPLLGVIPLKALGLELDLQNQRLVLLPETGARGYLSA